MRPDTFDLAAASIADVAGRPEPWLQLFPKWAEARRLSETEQRAVRAAILRVRAFGAKRPRSSRSTAA